MAGTRSSYRQAPAQDHDRHSGTTAAGASVDRKSFTIRNESTEKRSVSAETVADVALTGEHVKEAISLISRLEGLGLQRLQIPLPKCVVLGEQSTGKSSVIEAISGIKTPRATDTCTRCPLFISMQPSSDDWHARVVLRKTYSWDGKASRGGKFPGWTLLPTPIECDFGTTNLPRDLEWYIERAQLAILSPLAQPSLFLQPALPTEDEYHRCEFSPNVVCIHIFQPDLAPLAFYDLPGIIGQSESTAHHFLVKFVKDLVSDFVRDPDSLILVTCSLENDIANSTAGGIARDLRATDRCIGVLTKPDRLPPGSRDEKLRNVLDGNRFTLGHGYFVVKNLDQDAIDQGLGHREARSQERQFFETAPPWATVFQDYQERFGTANLQEFLSRKLAKQVTNMLPEIRTQVDARLDQVEADLKQLPEPPSYNAIRTISDIVLAFSDHVRKEIEAEYPHRDWRNAWETLHKRLLHDLVSMKPSMMTGGNLDQGIYTASTPGKTVDDSIVIDSEDEGEDARTSEPSPEEAPKKRRKTECSTPSPMKLPPSGSRHQTPNPPRSRAQQDAPNAGYSELRRVFKLDDVASHLKETSKSRIPDQLDPKVIDDMIVATIRHWHLPLRQFFTDLEQELNMKLQSIFAKHFGQWQGSALYQEAQKIVNELVETNFTEQRTTMALDSLNDEREGPFVFNEDVFNQELANTRESYRQARYRARLKLYAKEMQVQTNRPFTPQEKEKLRKDEKKQTLLMAEPYEMEVTAIARVNTYYMIAARRFYESVAIRVESKFFKRLRTTLRDDLDSGLGIHDDENGPQNAMRLLAEPAHRLEQRRELVAMKNALLQGLKCLQDLQDKYDDDGPRAHAVDGSSTSGDINGLTSSSFGAFSTPLAEGMDIAETDTPRR